ncbi:MAG TPA: helix-turn-helix transcriptional regulator [Cellulomonas sp.]
METPERFTASLAEVVAGQIKSAGLSQRDVSSRAGVPLVTLSRRLTGRSPFNIAELVAVASVLGVSVVDLALKAERAATSAAA